jgi:hypothetical protein
MPGQLNALLMPPDPQGWARRVYPMPSYDPYSADAIYAQPTAPATQTLNFDSMGYSEPEWRNRYFRMLQGNLYPSSEF